MAFFDEHCPREKSDLVRVNVEEAKRIGAARRGVHNGKGTRRFTEDPNYEDIVGVMGEMAFAEWSGLDAGCLNVFSLGGDGGVDFSFTVRGRKLTIDVKTAKVAKYLFLKQFDAARAADILVLAQAWEDEIRFCGWEHKSMMLVMPAKDFGYGIVNYYRDRSHLRPMWQLSSLIEMREEVRVP